MIQRVFCEARSPSTRQEHGASGAFSSFHPIVLAVAAVLLVATLTGWSVAAPSFPALTGRIVDGAGLLPAAARAAIETKLKELEDKSGIQLVVATVRSLDGLEIEPYANQLFRTWKLGEKQKNNGVLLLVAPNERKVRIEVGYGLEGTLTDALVKVIIANAIAPRFKSNDFAGGIERGVDDVITVLTTDSADWQARPELRAEDRPPVMDTIMPFLILMIFVIVFISIARSSARHGGMVGRGGTVFLPTGGSSWGGGSSSGGGFGGGFSGGGGSSGGGGASGGW